jgi:predicted dehydrogenase
VALVGPGSFARATHLPNLVALAPRATLRVVVGRTPNAAREAARRFGAARASTDLDEVLDDAGIDAVVLVTRHDLHAEQAARALEAGRAVLVEKPAAIDEDGLARLRAAVAATARAPTVDFNRRFAPLVTRLAEALETRRGPLVAHYSVTAERLPRDHWTLGPEGGGRLVGEACHMIDLLGFLVGSPRISHTIVPLVPRVGETRLGDDFALTCRYDDGSVTTLHYATVGSATTGKERLECRWDGTTALLDDFRMLRIAGDTAGGALAESECVPVDKGHAALLARFVDHVAGRGAPPIAWPEIDDVTSFTLALARELRGLPPWR